MSLGKYGVKEADLTVMEQDADKAIEMIREVDRLREEVTRKFQEANKQLNTNLLDYHSSFLFVRKTINAVLTTHGNPRYGYTRPRHMNGAD